MPMTKCPVCGVSVKDENLVRHVHNQHPHETVEGLEKLAPARPKSTSTRDWKDDLARLGVLVAVAGAIWFVLALLFPTPVGVMIPAFPGVLLVLLVGVGLLAGGWVLGSAAIQRSGTKFAVIGVVVGLAMAGVSAGLAAQQGVHPLSPPTAAPGNWMKADNPLWTINSRPVIFYYGSAGCPYCAASSWVVQGALQLFGSLSGYTFITSTPNEATPELRSIPGVDFVGATFSSSFLSLDVVAGNDNQVISAPTPPPIENSYVLTYDTQMGVASFPFYVVGGIYMRSGGLVDPTVFSTNGVMTASAVQQAIASGSGPVYTAIHSAQIYLEAYLAKACQRAGLTPPSTVTGDPAVAAVLAQL